MHEDSRINAVIAAMGKFASNTKDDRLSVMVSRAAARLQKQGQPFVEPLTNEERAVIKPFLDRIAA